MKKTEEKKKGNGIHGGKDREDQIGNTEPQEQCMNRRPITRGERERLDR